MTSFIVPSRMLRERWSQGASAIEGETHGYDDECVVDEVGESTPGIDDVNPAGVGHDDGDEGWRQQEKATGVA